ncbi:MAG: hypothetical protein ACYTEW_20385 [Planctomycetota bacterium]|jgi:hypothetical protein
MERRKTKTIQRRTWFGVEATVGIGSGLIHEAGVGGLVVPHPAVVNWLLRQGLADNARYTLTVTHEFGHLQSAPLALLYTGVLLAVTFATGHANLLKIVLVLVSTHAAWEIASEIFAIFSDLQLYRRCYKGVTIAPRIIFWIFTSVLTTIGWIIAMR